MKVLNIPFSDANDAPRLWEEQLTTSISFKGLELGNDSSLSGALRLPLLSTK
jgi:hypothetical protein